MTDSPEEPTSPDSWRALAGDMIVWFNSTPRITWSIAAADFAVRRDALLAAEDEQPATSRVAPHPSGWGQDRPTGVARDELYEPPRSAAPVDEHPPTFHEGTDA